MSYVSYAHISLAKANQMDKLKINVGEYNPLTGSVSKLGML